MKTNRDWIKDFGVTDLEAIEQFFLAGAEMVINDDFDEDITPSDNFYNWLDLSYPDNEKVNNG